MTGVATKITIVFVVEVMDHVRYYWESEEKRVETPDPAEWGLVGENRFDLEKERMLKTGENGSKLGGREVQF